MIRTALALFALCASACASAPANAPAEQPTDSQPNNEATAQDLATVPLGEALSVETSKEEPTIAAPSDCPVQDLVNYWGVECRGILAIIGKSELLNSDARTESIMVSGMITDFQNTGYAVTPEAQASLGEKISGQFATMKGNGEELKAFFGTRTSDSGAIRAFFCQTAEPKLDTKTCESFGEVLHSFARSNQVLGVSLYGQRVAFPAETKLGDRSAALGMNSIGWTIAEGEGHPAAQKNQTSLIVQVFQNRGMSPTVVPRACEFRGEKFDCDEIRFQAPNGPMQSSVVIFLPAAGGSLGLICDVGGELGDALPEPCASAFTVLPQ